MPQLGNDSLKCYGGQITLLYEDNGIKDFCFPTKMAMFCWKCSYLQTFSTSPSNLHLDLLGLGIILKGHEKTWTYMHCYLLQSVFKHLYLGLHII